MQQKEFLEVEHKMANLSKISNSFLSSAQNDECKQQMLKYVYRIRATSTERKTRVGVLLSAMCGFQAFYPYIKKPFKELSEDDIIEAFGRNKYSAYGGVCWLASNRSRHWLRHDYYNSNRNSYSLVSLCKTLESR